MLLIIIIIIITIVIRIIIFIRCNYKPQRKTAMYIHKKLYM